MATKAWVGWCENVMLVCNRWQMRLYPAGRRFSRRFCNVGILSRFSAADVATEPNGSTNDLPGRSR